jgi:hypothetical protein
MSLYDPDPIRVFIIGSRTFGCAVRDLAMRRAGFALAGICAPAGDPLAESSVVPSAHTTSPDASMIPDGTDLIVAAHNHRFIPPDMLDDTASSLWRRELFPMGLRLFDRVLGDILAGSEQRVPQDHDLATWEPRFDRAPLAAGVSA